MSATQWLERHQILVYLGALVTGAVVGLTLPDSSSVFEASIYPLLGALLYATFLQVPFTTLAEAVRDRRFLTAALVLNWGSRSICRKSGGYGVVPGR